MWTFKYPGDSLEFVTAAVGRFAQVGNGEAISRIVDCQRKMENACILEARRSTELPWLDLSLLAREIFEIGPLFFPEDFERQVKLDVPLNSLAVISVLFDLLISPQRHFKSIQQIIRASIRQEAEIRDASGSLIFNDEIARSLIAQEQSYWALFDGFMEEHPSLGEEPLWTFARRRAIQRRSELVRVVFDYAAHRVSHLLILQIEGNRNAQ
jgi:hypothetical protein